MCMQGGVFGAVATSSAFMAALNPSGTPAHPFNGVPAPPTANGHADTSVSASATGSTVLIPAAVPYEYELPLSHTALIMIDFQKDFFLPGGFGAMLGNDLAKLKVSRYTLRFHPKPSPKPVAYTTLIMSTFRRTASCWAALVSCWAMTWIN